jgi:excisionase family DNA binding protein
MPSDAAIPPRLLDRRQAAQYLGCSEDTIDRLIHTGQIGVVRLPVERSRHTSRGVRGVSRIVRIDRCELDSLIPKWRECGEPVQTTSRDDRRQRHPAHGLNDDVPSIILQRPQSTAARERP